MEPGSLALWTCFRQLLEDLEGLCTSQCTIFKVTEMWSPHCVYIYQNGTLDPINLYDSYMLTVNGNKKKKRRRKKLFVFLTSWLWSLNPGLCL